MTTPARPVDCTRCAHFVVTWIPATPRGCRAYGFRGVEYPSVVVLRETGVPCQLFAGKPRPPPSSPPSSASSSS